MIITFKFATFANLKNIVTYVLLSLIFFAIFAKNPFGFDFQIAFKFLKMLNSLTKKVDIFERDLHTPLKCLECLKC